MLVLPVADIKAYEHNPRLAENLEYPRLKDSIRTRRGLTTPLTVTKRPTESFYTIAAGGNSRLKALKELTEETGDDAFAYVDCRFEPWDSECQVFANHLIENDVRGNMTFGDKARAVAAWQALYEESHPDEPPLSQRQLVRELADAGYRVDQPTVTRFLNAARHLIPNLPALFGSGLGRPAAERLLRLRDCCERYWQDHAGSDAHVTFTDLFAQVCSDQDCHSADWDHAVFQSALSRRISDALNVDAKLVALDIDSLDHGYSVPAARDGKSVDDSRAAEQKSPWIFERAREIETARIERARARIGRRAEDGSQAGRTSDPVDDNEERESGSSSSHSSELPSTDLTRARQDGFIAAKALAACADLVDYVRPLETGFGFYIEAPEPSSVPDACRHRLTGPAQGLALTDVRSSCWWLLCYAAEQLTPQGLAALSEAYPASWLVELFTELPKQGPDQDPMAALQILVGEPTLADCVSNLLVAPSTGAEAFSALDQLLSSGRLLRGLAAGGATVWEEGS